MRELLLIYFVFRNLLINDKIEMLYVKNTLYILKLLIKNISLILLFLFHRFGLK
jgi:hypothetical protein